MGMLPVPLVSKASRSIIQVVVFVPWCPGGGALQELRRQADVFTDLVELQSKLGRDPSERQAPREPRHHAP